MKRGRVIKQWNENGERSQVYDDNNFINSCDEQQRTAIDIVHKLINSWSMQMDGKMFSQLSE